VVGCARQGESGRGYFDPQQGEGRGEEKMKKMGNTGPKRREEKRNIETKDGVGTRSRLLE